MAQVCVIFCFTSTTYLPRTFCPLPCFLNLYSGTEESLTAEAKATELLESIASLCGSPNTEMPVHEILSTLHSAKDKHIFRILATITDANHTMKARSRALDELPKRTASLGNSVSEWIRHLVKRCAMSDFMNSETTHHCVLLASESFKDNDVPSLSVFLSTIKIAVENFPALGAKDDTFLTLTDLFSDCRLESSNKIKSELQSYGAVTCLSSILSIAATARPENVPVGSTQLTCYTMSVTSPLSSVSFLHFPYRDHSRMTMKRLN